MATPTNPRLSVAHWGARLTPHSHSKSTTKSKPQRPDAGLSLRHVIGTTANSPNAIATLPSKNLLAFTAGAAAVICAFDDKLGFTQRFYRARPTAVPLNPIPTVYGPSTPTNGAAEFRARQARESVAGGASFSPSVAEWSDSPGGRSWTARERVKASTCVSFSPDGKYLAVGETGYRPRVLIFSTSKEASPDCPLTCLSDHTFGVRCVAFSPNSQYLASLGAANDGFLYIWSINSRNGSAILYASNKCTSNISQIAWMGTTLITVGTRHVKVWRPEGSTVSTPVSTPVKAFAGFFSTAQSTATHRILHGRNCLLGSLLEGTFTAVVPISGTQAFVCSELGDICLLDDSTGGQRFSSVASVGYAITSASITKDGDLVVAGKGTISTFKVKNLLASRIDGKRTSEPGPNSSFGESVFVALAPLGKRVVAVDDSRIIRLVHPHKGKAADKTDVELQLPAHGGPVLGVRPLPLNDVLKASFFTWSTDGIILFWGADGICKRQFSIPLEQGEGPDINIINELKVVRSVAAAGVMVSGDKLGVIRIIEEKTGNCVFSLRAHAGEITDIAVHEKYNLVASCGRDRTVQVFQKSGKVWELQQTLDEHVGAVTGLLFTSDAKHLISCSSDRTVVVRESLTRDEGDNTKFCFMITRTITLKATPASMCLLNGRSDVLLMSTIDRSVLKYNLETGHLANSFKTADSEGGDAVVLSSLIHLTTVNGANILAGVSSTDKSLRLYDENGNIIARDWGHTEGITDLTTTMTSSKSHNDEYQQRSLVTVAVDGTIFVWSYGAKSSSSKTDLSQSMELMGVTPTRDMLSAKPPMRRVLSQSEMARFRQSSPEQDDMTTPTNPGRRSHRPLEKKSSRFSLAQTPRLEPSLSSYDSTNRRRTRVARSPSPTSPNRKSPPRVPVVHRKASSDNNGTVRKRMSTTARASIGPGAVAPGDLSNNIDTICRGLRTFRRKLAATPDNLPPEALREIERELGLTARAVGEKALKSKGSIEESVMVKLLNQYSDRLIEMLDEKFKGVAVNGTPKANEKERSSSTSSTSGVEDETTAVEGATSS